MLMETIMGTASKFHGALLTETLDVKEMLSADGASGALAGVTKMVDNYGSSGFSLGQKIGVYAVVLGLVGAGITFALHGRNTRKTVEVKDSALPKIIGALLVFGAIVVVAFL